MSLIEETKLWRYNASFFKTFYVCICMLNGTTKGLQPTFWQHNSLFPYFQNIFIYKTSRDNAKCDNNALLKEAWPSSLNKVLFQDIWSGHDGVWLSVWILYIKRKTKTVTWILPASPIQTTLELFSASFTCWLSRVRYCGSCVCLPTIIDQNKEAINQVHQQGL